MTPFLILHKDLESLKLRLLDKTFIHESGCWICVAGGVESRYGTIWYLGSNISCHRASWMVHKGPITDGMQVLHTCDVKGCINPEHLFLGNSLINMQDKHAKGRNDPRHGIYNPAAVLNEDKVREIRSLKGTATHQEIANRFGVSQSVVTNVINRKTWSHVE